MKLLFSEPDVFLASESAPKPLLPLTFSSVPGLLFSSLFSSLFSLLPGLLSGCLSGFLLSGCASTGAVAVAEQSRLELTIEAATTMNPDARGRAAPLAVRIYELKNAVGFEQADFFSLQSNDNAVLAGDVLVKNDYLLRPGESQLVRRKSLPGTEFIGVLASYRDLPNSVWRSVYKMPVAPEATWYRAVIPSNKTVLHITLDSNAIKMEEERQ